ncbi:MAG TPA: alanine--glyoxylate aminotransferase family protein [Candidatus Baltobacteraceae bacterium]|nr:alanine--glyoxylate aminotransferase family protein [Candidatus Baltobacteraceae bacterium]
MQRHLLFIPGPVTVAEPVLAALAHPLIDHRGPEFAALLGRLEHGMQPIFGTSAEVVVLGSSGTGGLEAAVSSSFSAGDKILAAPVGVFGKRLAAIAKAYGLEVEILETPYGHALDPEALAARLRAPGAGGLKGILLTHNETSTGVQNDMEALAAAIGDHPATVIVDSVSGLGATEFRMDEWGFDIVVTASQKALAAPPGLALVALAPRAWERMGSASAPHFYFDLKKAREFARNGQTPWTPPVSLAFALDAAIERYRADGAPAAWARHARYANAIRAAAQALGLDVFSQPNAHSVTVVALSVPPGVDAQALQRTLREQYGVVMGGGQQDLKGKIIRMGTMGALSRTDILGALGALELALLEHGHTLSIGAGVRAALEVFLADERSPALSR